MTSRRAPLSRAPVRARVGGYEFWIPYRPAARWSDEAFPLDSMVARMADQESRDALVDVLMTQPGAAAEMAAESRRVLLLVSGWRWWEAQKLIRTAIGSEVLGRLVLAGVDPWQRTLGEWCAATYALCAKGADARERLKLDFSLSIPPPGAEGEWDDDGDDAEVIGNAVQAMMGQ